MTKKDQLPELEYQYGFKDKDVSIYKTKKGINAEIVEEISKIKKEPQWMTDFRLKSYDFFAKKDMPHFGPDLSELNFDDYTYYIRPSEKRSAPDFFHNMHDTTQPFFEMSFAHPRLLSSSRVPLILSNRV